MRDDGRRESIQEMKIVFAIIGATFGLLIAAARYITRTSAKAAFADQLRRIERRRQLRDGVIRELVNKGNIL